MRAVEVAIGQTERLPGAGPVSSSATPARQQSTHQAVTRK
jgi:hypothetical protein